MKKLLLPILLPALLAGCAMPAPEAGLQSVRLTDSKLTLVLSDGTRCSVDWQKAPAGRMEHCGPGYGYAVRVEQNPNLLRQLAEGIVLALGGSGVLQPMAEVVVTGPGGTDQVFVFPDR